MKGKVFAMAIHANPVKWFFLMLVVLVLTLIVFPMVARAESVPPAGPEPRGDAADTVTLPDTDAGLFARIRARCQERRASRAAGAAGAATTAGECSSCDNPAAFAPQLSGGYTMPTGGRAWRGPGRGDDRGRDCTCGENCPCPQHTQGNCYGWCCGSNCPGMKKLDPNFDSPTPMGGDFRIQGRATMPTSTRIPARAGTIYPAAGSNYVPSSGAVYGPFNAVSGPCTGGQCQPVQSLNGYIIVR